VKRIDTPFDGTLEAELTLGGYTEDLENADWHCEFNFAFELGSKALDIDDTSKEGRPNDCFWFQHWDCNAKDEQSHDINKKGQTYIVDEKMYQVCIFRGQVQL
jgi:hypothetical protein